jgi:hypothetical protein
MDRVPDLYDCAADLDEDWPAPAEQRSALDPARPRVRYCRRLR